MIDIVPAILPKSTQELDEALLRLKGLAPLIQIDLVGENILAGEEAVPDWQDFDFEFDLMTNDSLQDARRAIDLGASRIVVHTDFPKAKEATEMLRQTREGDYPVLVGVALPSHASTDDLNEYEGLYDYVQVMGIDRVGKQGEPADPHHKEIELVMKLRAQYPDMMIQVDGAVAPHIEELVQAGASRLIIGSAIINADDPHAVYKELYTRANAHRG